MLFLYECGDYENATDLIPEWNLTDDFYDAEEFLCSCYGHLYGFEYNDRLMYANEGDIVSFGNYCQYEFGAYSSPIEWIVVERDGTSFTLLSRYAPEAMPFYTWWDEDVTWSISTLRDFPNDVFIHLAFASDALGKTAGFPRSVDEFTFAA